jgi:putative cardiolipin synthase
MIVQVIAWLVALGLVGLAASAIALRSWNRFARRARGPVTTCLPRGDTDTPLDRLLDPLEGAHPGAAGLATLLDGREAFAARSASASLAGRSLDLIYYIWATDTSGWLLMADLIAAADRGVRVRLLLDDVNVQGFDFAFLSLTKHPNIEVRLFNPLRSRGHWIRRGLEMGLGLTRFNRRMHGKVWIADGRLAILGGRNVGDTYFAAPGSGVRHSADADMILTGPPVAQVEALFDSYWNLGLSLPILTLWPRLNLPMRRFRRRLARKAGAILATDYRKGAMAGREAPEILTARLRWTTEVEVLADPPDKAFGRQRGLWMAESIRRQIDTTKDRLCITTPYFVPGNEGLALLSTLAQRGVKVTVLTNSLSATDIFAVHGAYSHYRPALLRAGVGLFEYAPPRNARGQRGLLHSKVFLFDADRALVGSYNFDLRSYHTNIELGLLFREPALVAELSALFDHQTSPEQAFEITLEDGRLHWNIVEDGRPGRERAEPESGLARRIGAWLIGRVPHDYF